MSTAQDEVTMSGTRIWPRGSGEQEPVYIERNYTTLFTIFSPFRYHFPTSSVVSDAQMEGFVGRKDSFEVTLNGVKIHSKLETKAFPDTKEVKV